MNPSLTPSEGLKAVEMPPDEQMGQELEKRRNIASEQAERLAGQAHEMEQSCMRQRAIVVACDAALRELAKAERGRRGEDPSPSFDGGESAPDRGF
jgi:hypothetical protein